MCSCCSCARAVSRPPSLLLPSLLLCVRGQKDALPVDTEEGVPGGQERQCRDTCDSRPAGHEGTCLGGSGSPRGSPARPLVSGNHPAPDGDRRGCQPGQRPRQLPVSLSDASWGYVSPGESWVRERGSLLWISRAGWGVHADPPPWAALDPAGGCCSGRSDPGLLCHQQDGEGGPPQHVLFCPGARRWKTQSPSSPWLSFSSCTSSPRGCTRTPGEVKAAFLLPVHDSCLGLSPGPVAVCVATNRVCVCPQAGPGSACRTGAPSSAWPSPAC